MNLCSLELNGKLTLLSSLFGAVRLTKNENCDKFSYLRSEIGLNSRGTFWLSDGSRLGKNEIIFGICSSSSAHTDKIYIYILILGKDPTQGLDNTTLLSEAEYYLNFSKQQKRFCLRLHYNQSNSFLFINEVKLYLFKAKYSELIGAYPIYLASISEGLILNNIKKRECMDGFVVFQFFITVLMLVIS